MWHFYRYPLRSAELLNFGSRYSFVIWIYPESLSGEPRIFDRSTPDEMGFKLDFTNLAFSPPLMKLRFCIAKDKCFHGRHVFVARKWAHVAVSFDSTVVNGVKLFVNGKLDSIHNAWNQPTKNVKVPITFGCAANPFRSDHFEGMIDDISIWERTISLPEVQALQFQQLFGDEIGLLAYYTFNNIPPEEKNIPDISQNQRNGTVAGKSFLVKVSGKPLHVSKHSG